MNIVNYQFAMANISMQPTDLFSLLLFQSVQENPRVILAGLGRNMITGQGGSLGEDW